MSIAPNVSMRMVFTLICLVGLTMIASALFPNTASADRLQRCAREGGICRLPYPSEVVFGVQGRSTSRFFDRDAVPCSTRVFGDPAPGRQKACFIVTSSRKGKAVEHRHFGRHSFDVVLDKGFRVRRSIGLDEANSRARFIWQKDSGPFYSRSDLSRYVVIASPLRLHLY